MNKKRNASLIEELLNLFSDYGLVDFDNPLAEKHRDLLNRLILVLRPYRPKKHTDLNWDRVETGHTFTGQEKP